MQLQKQEELHDYVPFWADLTEAQRRRLEQTATYQTVPKGYLFQDDGISCLGMLVLHTGQLRSYSMSGDGREITLYRLFSRDMCVLSSYCIMNSLQFDVSVQAEKETSFWRIPSSVYKELMQQSPAVANYTTELIASRLSDIMWLLNQILFHHIDSRLAAFLLSEIHLEHVKTIHLTHEEIAQHLGTAREVVSRMLKHFALNGLVEVNRGRVTLLNEPELMKMAKESIR